MSGSLAAAAIGAAAGAAIAIAATNFTRPAQPQQPQAPPVVVPPTPPRGLPPSAAGDALSVEGQVALVTGGGTGIGREIARVLLAAGASVVITGRRQEVLEDTVASLSAEAEGRVASVVGDVGQEADAQAMVARAVELFGGLDILVNNAGVVAASGVFADVEAADFDAVIATNLRGTFLVSRAAIRQMREQGRGGALVNNSSCCGVAAWRNLAAYVRAAAPPSPSLC